MRIGFDARCLEEEKISGVGEYALELLKNILEIDKKNQYKVFSNSWKKRTHRLFTCFEKYPNVRLKRFSFPNKILNLLFWYLGRPKIDKLIGGADIFFAPNINFLSISANCQLIATFHDLSFERFSSFFSWKTIIWHKYFVNPKKIARAAETIVTVSESTKNDLEEVYKIDPQAVKVVYHGVSPSFKRIDRNNPKLLKVQKKYKLPYKFIFFLGNIEPRKNISSIVAAYNKLLIHHPELKKYRLVMAGNISPLCRNIIEKENILTCGYVEREDRPYIYNLASLFVYPSFFEGFGLPVLEAMACSLPVVTSNTSSIPEVVGESAVLIDPNRPSEMTAAMEALLMDKNFYNKMQERGLAQSQKFSWKKCANETLNIIDHAHRH